MPARAWYGVFGIRKKSADGCPELPKQFLDFSTRVVSRVASLLKEGIFPVTADSAPTTNSEASNRSHLGTLLLLVQSILCRSTVYVA